MVLEYLHNDLKTLWSLPLVKKVCFKVAVPLRYYNPHKDWTNTDPIKAITLQSEKFVALLFASMAHSQRIASQLQATTASTTKIHHCTQKDL